jgi:uncharacterized integral membrane protein
MQFFPRVAKMNIKAYTGLALLLLVVVFIVQNAAVVGWITAGHFHRKHSQSKE